MRPIPSRRLAASLGALLSALLAASPAAARSTDTYWLSCGLGGGALGSRDHAGAEFGKFAAETSGFLQRGTRVMGVRACSTDGAMHSDAWDVGALYGVATRPARLHAFVAGGVGYESHSIDGATGEDAPRRNKVCLPLEAEVTFRPFYLVGVGGFAYASLVRGESATALGAVVEVGRLR